MVKTYLYLPEELNTLIAKEAIASSKSKAETIRELLTLGIQSMKSTRNMSANVLKDAEIVGKKYQNKGYEDLSSKMDDYLWKDTLKDE